MSEVGKDLSEERLGIAVEFIRRLFNPEVYGLQLSEEVRRETFRTLCMVDDSTYWTRVHSGDK